GCRIPVRPAGAGVRPRTDRGPLVESGRTKVPQGRTHLSGSLVGLALVVAAVAIPSTQATRVSAQTGFLAAALRGQQRVVHTANGDHLQASISAGTLEA